MKKRFLIALLMAVVAGNLVFAVGSSEKTPAGKQLVFAYSQAELVNAWRVTNQRDFEDTAKKYGVKLISIDANRDQAKQLADVQSMLAQKPDVMIVSPIEAKACVPVVDMCAKANVPLIVIDRTIEAEPGKGIYKTNIFQSHVLSGERLAMKAVEILTKKNGKPKGNVVHIQGMAGASVVIDANQGWDNVMAKYPDIKVVATVDAGWTKEGGMKAMEDFLQRFPKGAIDAVKSDYSDMTMGAIDAIRNAGRTELLGFILGEGGHFKCIEEVISGTIARETQTPPYSAEVTFSTAMKVLKGEAIQATMDVPALYFDKDKPAEAKAYLEKIRAKGLEF